VVVVVVMVMVVVVVVVVAEVTVVLELLSCECEDYEKHDKPRLPVSSTLFQTRSVVMLIFITTTKLPTHVRIAT
jgi:hypothetical protein